MNEQEPLWKQRDKTLKHFESIWNKQSIKNLCSKLELHLLCETSIIETGIRIKWLCHSNVSFPLFKTALYELHDYNNNNKNIFPMYLTLKSQHEESLVYLGEPMNIIV